MRSVTVFKIKNEPYFFKIQIEQTLYKTVNRQLS